MYKENWRFSYFSGIEAPGYKFKKNAQEATDRYNRVWPGRGFAAVKTFIIQ